jgi:SAM-dependent methyltransferase
MSLAACGVCGAPFGEPVYRHDGDTSISSTATPVATPTVVYVCRSCAHIQTPPLADAAAYYQSAYNVHLDSEATDDLYAVRDGVPVFRARHQAGVVLEKVPLAPGAAVLDYGCGKAMTLRTLLGLRPDLVGAVFDVSDAYRFSWDEFLPREEQASFVTPDAWQSRFDVVLSFFALEHAPDPIGFLREIRALLRPGGTIHLVVPNVRENVGDFVVVDHVNHFMPSSLRRAFAAAGFDDVQIDEQAHASAYVVDARKAASAVAQSDDDEAVQAFMREARGYAAYWAEAGDAVRRFEADVAAGRPSAIYGSGFYGVFIASRLRNPGAVAYFLDRNPHQQAKIVLEKPVRDPAHVGPEIEVVYAGLNPARSREIVAGIPELRERERRYFFL